MPAQAEAAAGMAAMNSAALTLGSSALIAQKSLDLMTGSTLRNTEAILANVTALNLQAGAIKAVPTAKAVKAAGTANATADQVAAARAVKNMAINAATQEVAALRVAAAHDIAAAKVATALAAQNAAEARAAQAALAYAEAQERAAARVAAAQARAAKKANAPVSLTNTAATQTQQAVEDAERLERIAQESERKRASWGKAASPELEAQAQKMREAAAAARVLSSAEVAAATARATTIPGIKRVGDAIKSSFKSSEIYAMAAALKKWSDSFSGMKAPDALRKIGGDLGSLVGLKSAIGSKDIYAGAAAEMEKLGTGIKKSAGAAAAAKNPFYTFSILTRSILSAGTVTNLQGGVYYFTLIGRALKGVAMAAGMAATGLVLAGLAFTKILAIGAKAEGITTVFDNMTRSAGMAGEALLERLTAASHGAIAQVDLMKVANRALIAGGADIANSLPRLLEIARASSIATGQDMNFAYDSLIKGIVRASPKLIDNADIYLKIGDAVGEYAASIGKTVPQLNAQERQIAVLNAVLREGDKFINQMGLSGVLASERMASLPAALKDVGSALGELAVQSGFAESIGGMGDFFRDLAKTIQVANNIDNIRDSLNALGTTSGLTLIKDFDAAVASLNQRAYEGIITNEQAQAGYAELVKGLNMAYQAELRLIDTETIMRKLEIDRAFALEKSKQPITDVAAALQLFADAANEATASSAGLGPIVQGWAKLWGDMQGMATFNIAPPNLNTNSLGIDTPKLREYIGVMKELFPELYQGAKDKGRDFDKAVTSIDAMQTAAMNWAASGKTTEEQLNRLAQGTFGFDATWNQLVSDFEKMPAATQTAASAMGLLSFALADIVAQTKAPVTLKVQVEGFADVVKGIDSMLLSAADFMPYDKLLSLQDEYTKEADARWRAFLAAKPLATQLEQDLEKAQDAKFFQEKLDAQINYAKQASDIAAQLAKLTENPLPARKKEPGIGATLLTTDIQAWREYANAMRALYPAETVANQKMGDAIKKMEETQQAALATAEKMGWTAEAFDIVGQAAFGMGGDLTSVVTRFLELGSSAQSAIPGVKALGLAIQKLHAEMTQPFDLNIKDLYSSYEEGAKKH